MLWLQRLFTSSQPSTYIVSTHLWWVAQQSASQKFAEMPPKKLYLSDTHRRGARARKDQRNAKRAAKRAAKAAALREIGDIQEDVVPYEHKGGEVGETIRLQRMNPSSVSGNAAQPAPQLPLPVASPPPQLPAPPPEPLSDIAAAEAHLPACLPSSASRRSAASGPTLFANWWPQETSRLVGACKCSLARGPEVSGGQARRR